MESVRPGLRGAQVLLGAAFLFAAACVSVLLLATEPAAAQSVRDCLFTNSCPEQVTSDSSSAPPPPSVDHEQIALAKALSEARDWLRDAEPSYQLWPNASSQVVHLNTFLYVTDGDAGRTFHGSSGGVSVAVHLAVDQSTWTFIERETGKTDVVSCDGPGTPWSPGLESSDCAKSYTNSSAVTGLVDLEVRVLYTNTWSSSAGNSGDLGTASTAPAEGVVAVNEVLSYGYASPDSTGSTGSRKPPPVVDDERPPKRPAVPLPDGEEPEPDPEEDCALLEAAASLPGVLGRFEGPATKLAAARCGADCEGADAATIICSDSIEEYCERVGALASPSPGLEAPCETDVTCAVKANVGLSVGTLSSGIEGEFVYRVITDENGNKTLVFAGGFGAGAGPGVSLGVKALIDGEGVGAFVEASALLWQNTEKGRIYDVPPGVDPHDFALDVIEAEARNASDGAAEWIGAGVVDNIHNPIFGRIPYVGDDLEIDSSIFELPDRETGQSGSSTSTTTSVRATVGLQLAVPGDSVDAGADGSISVTHTEQTLVSGERTITYEFRAEAEAGIVEIGSGLGDGGPQATGAVSASVSYEYGPDGELVAVVLTTRNGGDLTSGQLDPTMNVTTTRFDPANLPIRIEGIPVEGGPEDFVVASADIVHLLLNKDDGVTEQHRERTRHDHAHSLDAAVGALVAGGGISGQIGCLATLRT